MYLWITAVIAVQTWRHSEDLLRTYVNEKADLRLTLHGSTYSLEEGSPLTVPKAKRQVDFEDGSIVSFAEGNLTLKCWTIFHSPTRSNYWLLTMGGPRDGFGNGPEADLNRRKLMEELPSRISVNHSRRALKLVHQGGQIMVNLDGMTLKAVPKGK